MGPEHGLLNPEERPRRTRRWAVPAAALLAVGVVAVAGARSSGMPAEMQLDVRVAGAGSHVQEAPQPSALDALVTGAGSHVHATKPVMVKPTINDVHAGPHQSMDQFAHAQGTKDTTSTTVCSFWKCVRVFLCVVCARAFVAHARSFEFESGL